MTQEANAGMSKGDRKPGTINQLLRWVFSHNWPDTGGCPSLKGR
jgi:hypothetical protein